MIDGTVMNVSIGYKMRTDIEQLADLEDISMSEVAREAFTKCNALYSDTTNQKREHKCKLSHSIHFYVDKEMYDHISKRSEIIGVPMSNLIRECLSIYLILTLTKRYDIYD